MKEETLWEHTEGLYEADLRRVEADGKTFWSLGTQELHTNYGGQAEVDLDREALEKLFRAIQKELYPEQAGVSFKRTPEEILTTLWEYEPTHCPVCGERLRRSRLYSKSAYCVLRHGKTYTVTINDKIWYKWFLIELPPPAVKYEAG